MGVFTGPDLALIDRDPIYDPQLGESVFELWRGSQAGISMLYSAMRAMGARVTTKHQGLLWTLEATIGVAEAERTGSPSETQSQWDVDTEFIQESFWSSPKVWSGYSNNPDLVATAKKLVEAQLVADNGGPVTPTATGFSGITLQVYKALLRGVEAYEVNRPVLKLVRTIPIVFQSPYRVDLVPTVYSTVAMRRLWSIPVPVVAKLPVDPDDKPEGTTWAWKPRQCTYKYVLSVGKVQEDLDWVFAAWADLLYDVVTT